MKNCPRCQEALGDSATGCRCGWRDRTKKNTEQQTTVKVDCAHADCSGPAIVNQKTNTGWANLCFLHYGDSHKRHADAYCEKLGLNTVADKLKWLRDNPLKVKRAPIDREPGEDWGET